MVKAGQLYTINQLKQSCCHVSIDVGIKTIDYNGSGRYSSICGACGIKEQLGTNNTYWFHELLFAPLEYDKQAIEELLENTLVKSV